MKARPPAPAQLALLPSRSELARFVVEPSARPEILRALAEVLLAAAEAGERKEKGHEAR
jgi:hypothetical protein